MYHSCIYCSADLGSNDALEAFPVGRSVAYDGERGRLWAVCTGCARWNLAPIEERWEAIEAAERLFRDTRTRVQGEHVGLARLRDGTRLVRVGRAPAGELAVWRYGAGLLRRRTRYRMMRALGLVGHGGAFTAGLLVDGRLQEIFSHPVAYLRLLFTASFPLARVSAEESGGVADVVLPQRSFYGAVLSRTDDGGLRLWLPRAPQVRTETSDDAPLLSTRDLVLHGDAARRVLTRGMVHVNGAGAGRDLLQRALDSLAAVDSPAEYVTRLAGENVRFGGLRHAPVHYLALEMALHEETERRAMEGELAALEEMWRQAEEIAAIADRLPDGETAESK
jgi:hypothetical protein